MMEQPGAEQLQREVAGLLAGYSTAAVNAWDAAERVPEEVLGALAAAGLLGVSVEAAHGGRQWDAQGFGMLCAELGQLSLSLLSLFTVHSMVLEAIRLWGTVQQQAYWLPELAAGRQLGAFALTEPDYGSEATGIQTRLQRCEQGYRLTGRKKWISGATRADLLLVFARLEDDALVACLLPRAAEGVEVQPMRGLLGFRAAMVGEIEFRDCVVPAENLIGRPGTGVSHVAAAALDLGRLAIAFGCTGAMEACLADTIAYASRRRQFDQPLAGHQLVLGMLTDMMTAHRASVQLCRHAAELRSKRDPLATTETAIAKYHASTHAVRVADHAVQIHGAAGCSAVESRVERFYRDLKITEIIEGSNQMQQLMIARNSMGQYLKTARWRERLREGAGS